MAWPPATHQDVQDEITNAQDGAVSLVRRLRTAEALIGRGPFLRRPLAYWSYNAVSTSTTLAATADRLEVAPLYLPSPVTVDRIRVEVTTAGSAGHVARTGIWRANATSLLPAALVLDSGSYAVDTTGFKEVTISLTMHGFYWLGVTAQSGSFRIYSNTHALNAMASSTVAQSSPAMFIPSIAPTSALTSLDSVALGSWSSSASAPMVQLRSA